ncbi:antigen WC1.1-like [Dendronephthya gigantea]|uniref:antigen WC1.1-like n=1 Tax=Dendronephthya gigantea TaxID=151771 RepID=UPI00106D223E|nr:antigen WC1.1-like [Dendronephthya gigantea]
MISLVFLLVFGGILDGFEANFASKCCGSSCAHKDSCTDEGKNLYKGYCVSKCPIGNYAKDNKCSSCPSLCSSCSGQPCLSCKDSKFLWKNGKCAPVCPQDAKLAKNSSSPRVRLVAGRSSLEGVVEVYHDGVWGTICADGWTDSNADVICKELNLGAVMESKIVHQDRFKRQGGYKYDRIWLSALKCKGTESSIFNCDKEWDDNSCSHLEDVGIRCSGPDSSKRCVTSCGDGYFESNGKCFECPLDCKTCTSLDKCSSCNEERFLEGDSCVAECKPGTFGDSKTLKCKQCPDECETCIDSGCKSCKYEKFLIGGKCVDKCSSGVSYSKYLRLSGNHSSPYMGLLEVKYQGEWHTVCDDLFYLRTARVFCRELGYGEPIKYRNTGFGMGKGRILTRNVLCLGFEKSFLDCSQSEWFSPGCSHHEDVGLSCQPPIKGPSVLPHRCMEDCPDGTFQNKQNQCELCNRKCLTCAKGPESCLDCRKTFFHNGTTCVRTCPDGTYPNTTVRACLSCNKECMTCDGRPDVCLSCVPPLVQKGSYCGKKCPDGTYQKEYTCVENCGLWHYHGKDKMCHTCPPNCIMCSSDGKCKACKNGLVFTKDGKCSTSCPRGQYSTPVEPSSVGIDMQLRLTSVEGFKYKGRLEIKHQGVWGSICDDGWGYQNAVVACRQLLLGPPVQIVYLRSYRFVNMKILLDDVNCKGNEDSLTQCEVPGWDRHNCAHSEDVHIECSPPGLSRCDVECPPAYFVNGSSCSPCSVNCSSCTGSANNCSLCKEGSFLANDGSCVTNCPPGFYPSDKKHCKACHSRCWTCDGEKIKDCTSCKPPYFLLLGGCVLNCTKEFYKRSSNPFVELWGKVGPYEGVAMVTMKGKKGFVCSRYLRVEQGNVVCKELNMGHAERVYSRSMYRHWLIPLLIKNPVCTGNESSILQCPVQKYLRYCSRRSILAVKCSGPDLIRKCLERCPTDGHFYINNANHEKTCDHCSENCLRCEINATNCISCPEGQILTWDKKCVSYCPEGTFFHKNKCEKCESTCLACYQNKQNCITCAHGRYVKAGNCLDKCENIGWPRVGSPSVRLVRYSSMTRSPANASLGVVEMFVDGNWFPVCGINWDIRAAAVACRELGYGDPIKIISGPSSLNGYTRKLIKKLNCTGRENTLSKCGRIGSCEYFRLAGVQCSRATPKKECVKLDKPCGTGFFRNYNKEECQACSSDCITCSGTASHCTSCNYTHVLHGSKCLEECPDGYYIDLEMKTCKRCSDRCKTCFDGVSNDKCSSCNKPYFLRDTSCVDSCYPDRTLEDLMRNKPPASVRLINGSNPREGFIQLKKNDGAWGNICYMNIFVRNLVCQELGFQSASILRSAVAYDLSNVWSITCSSYKSSLKDCSVVPLRWCTSRSFIACSKRRLDKRVCRKVNKVPCSPTVCARAAPCVDGDDKVIPTGHSFCRSCPPNYYGDGDNCTAISKILPSITIPFVNKRTPLGLPLYLRCYGRTSRAFLTANRYSWYKDGKRLNVPHSSFRRPIFLRAHYRDAGIYTCVLRTSVGSTTKTFNVTVVGAPLIEKADNVDAVIGDSAMLECKVFANPPATLEWVFNNITLNENSTSDGGPRVLKNGSLWINQTKAKHAGNYSCIAKNYIRTVVEVIRLRVGEELRFERKGNTAVVSKGGNARLSCVPHKSDSSWSIIWRRNGKTLKTVGRYKVLEGSLTIQDVNSEDCGQYYCVAKDTSSIITSIATVVIKDDPPCIHTRPQNLHLEDGMYARFYCAASGEPTPQIFWQNETKASNVFEIKKVDISHVGVYKCSARSGDKFNEAFAFLSVNDHHACPYIFEKPKSTSVMPGQTVVFHCKAVADTSSTIEWHRNGHRIVSSDKYKIEDGGRKLTVNNVKKDDLGEYKCVVKDKYGETTATGSVNALNAEAFKVSSSSPNTAGIIIGVLVCILVIIIVLYFVHRYRRYGDTPASVISDVKRKTVSRFQSSQSHTVLKNDTTALVEDNDDDAYDDNPDANPFVRD